MLTRRYTSNPSVAYIEGVSPVGRAPENHGLYIARGPLGLPFGTSLPPGNND